MSNKPIDQTKHFAWLPTYVIACRKDPRKTKQLIWLEFYYEETQQEKLKVPNKAAAFVGLPDSKLYYYVLIRVKYWNKD